MDTNNNANESSSLPTANNQLSQTTSIKQEPRSGNSDPTANTTNQPNSTSTEPATTTSQHQQQQQQQQDTTALALNTAEQGQPLVEKIQDQQHQIELHATYDASDVLNNESSPQKYDENATQNKQSSDELESSEQQQNNVLENDESSNVQETVNKSNIICVKESESDGAEPIEIELESDKSLLLTSLTSLYPGATGLKYRHPGSNTLRGVKLANGRFLQPIDSWSAVPSYLCVFNRGSKRKNEADNGTGKAPKQTKNDQQGSTSDGSDLVVLGLPWTTTEASMKSYFEQYGEVSMAQVKTDPKTGKSRGFGFVRFAKSNAQHKLLSMRHMIDGRWCDVRVPLSKAEADATKAAQLSRKIFVGRLPDNITTEDLREHFSSFGALTDVFIPKPFRNFAFVTFGTSDMAQSLFKHKHVINGATVQISEAIPRDNVPNNHGFNNNNVQQTNNSNNYGAAYGNVSTNNIHPFTNSYTHQAPVSHYHSAKAPATNIYTGGWKQQQQQQHPQPSYYPMPSYSSAGAPQSGGSVSGYSQPTTGLNGGPQYFKMPQHQMMPQTHLGHNSTYPQLSSSSSSASPSYSNHGANNFSRNTYSSVWK